MRRHNQQIISIIVILFIADLHLQEARPETTAAFLRFLYDEALFGDALYILGDLFDFWIGDDDPNPLHRKMAYAIKKLVNSGTPCYFIHGNRDFLIGKKFAKESGIMIINGEKVLNLYGRKVLIMHGDTLCTNDSKYRIFRASIHMPLVKKLFLALPLFIRSHIAKKIRDTSKAINKKKASNIIDVNPKTVIKVMEKHQVQWLIYGHTHRPSIKKIIANNKSAFYITLGAWYEKGSMVKVTKNSIELLYFPV